MSQGNTTEISFSQAKDQGPTGDELTFLGQGKLCSFGYVVSSLPQRHLVGAGQAGVHSICIPGSIVTCVMGGDFCSLIALRTQGLELQCDKPRARATVPRKIVNALLYTFA